MINGFTESDWKLFRKKISDWQENYMEKLTKEYMELLSGEGNASEKFWTLEKRIKQDRRNTGVVCEMRRSMLIENVISLIYEGAITMDDLNEFSDEFQNTIRVFVERRSPRDF